MLWGIFEIKYNYIKEWNVWYNKNKGDFYFVHPIYNDIVGYVGNTGHCKGWDKTLQKSFELDGINEDAEKKAARERGVGAHLHLQMFLGDWFNDKVFFEETNANIPEKIRTRGVKIFNPCKYDDPYFNN